MIVQFSRSAKRRSARTGRPVSQNSTAWPCARRDPGPVDIRYRLELAPRGMRGGASPALHVLELPQKGGDPAAPSGTATLLRLHPSHEPHLRRLPPRGLGHRLRVLLTPVV